MNTKNALSLLFAFVVLCTASVRAEQVTLRRQDALDLYRALDSMQAGLNPANTTNAADDISALRDTAEALNKGNIKASRLAQLIPANDPSAAKKAFELVQPQEDIGLTTVTLELVLFEVSADEIKSASIAPHTLSLIRSFLRPVPPKK